jgi:Nif-specific regulatory protein
MPSRTTQDQRAHVELIAMYAISRILCGSLDIDRSFRAALAVLAAQLDLPRSMVVLPDDTQTGLNVRSSVGLTQDQVARGTWQLGEGVVGQVFAAGMPAVISDVGSSLEPIHRTGAFAAEPAQAVALIAVPLRTESGSVGVLVARRMVGGGERLSDDQRILTMVASLMAQAFQLHQAVSGEYQRLQSDTSRLRKALRDAAASGRDGVEAIVGDSAAMRSVLAELRQAAPSRATILLRGESGTGKEAFARAIHQLSPRKEGPFIKVNCAALSETLLESELFGHERGAFTGAVGDRKGRFELAHGGSLFLDEIGDISLSFQAKLLRVLQEREFERVGGGKALKVDVRLVCATNRDLETMVREGGFRADLYYRINVIALYLPPLRDRRSDIPALVAHFLARYNEENRRRLSVAPEAVKVLMGCRWPGNVRELENCLERAATMARTGTIRVHDIACQQAQCLTGKLHHFEAPLPSADEGATPQGDPVLPKVPRPPAAPAGGAMGQAGERERLIGALEQCGWVQAKAARLLKVSPRQLAYALQRHRIQIRKL